MGATAVALKRNKETATSLIYCCIIALCEVALYIIQKSSLNAALPTLLSEIDMRLIFLPCAALIQLLRGEKKSAFVFAALYALGSVALAILGFAGIIQNGDWKQAIAPVVKAAVLLTACKINTKTSRAALIAVYALCETLNIYTLYTLWSMASIALVILLLPSIVLWIKGLLPEQDIYTGLYNVSTAYSMQRLLSIAASFICGFLFMILAISLLGSYSALFTSIGIYLILISCALSWMFAFLLLNMAD